MSYYSFRLSKNQVETSRAIEILICCSRTQIDEHLSQQIRSLVQEADWATLLQSAIYHNVLPLVYKALNGVCVDLVPEPIMKQLRELYNNNTFHVLSLTAELVKILEFLRLHDIPVVPFKGPILSVLAYGSLSLRSFQDLDILVKLPDYFQPRNLLIPQGYKAPAHLLASEQYQNNYHKRFGEYVLVNEEKNVYLDVHHRCLGGDWLILSADFTRFWQRLMPVSIAGKTVMSLQTEDLLLYLCVNGTKDCWKILRSVCDVAELIRRHPHLNWDAVVQEVQELRIERILKSGLLIATQLLNVDLPVAILEYIQGDHQAQWLADRVCRRLRGELPDLDDSSIFEKVIFRLVAIEHWQDQVKYCLRLPIRTFRRFFTLNYRDQVFLPLPRPLYFLYYLIRPIRLLRDHGLRIIKLALP